MIPKENYYSNAALKVELDDLFDNGYQFAALTSELAKDRDFVCVDYCGRAVVVQNFRGVIKAFQNVCTHRFNRIQTEISGNRPLACSYHGWTFNADGFPVGLPKRDQFLGRDDVDPDTLCLVQYKVATCGTFVFFKIGDSAGTLEDYLGDFHAVLEDLSTHMGDRTYFGTVAHQANWKILVENVLECYHCSVVHPETFGAQLGVGRAPIEQIVASGDHTSAHFPRTHFRREDLRKRLFKHLAHRTLSHDSFFHIHIFPNLFITSSEGLTFYVGHALPQTATETDLRIRYLSPAITLDEKQTRTHEKFTEDSIAIGLRVIEEDRAMLENVQKGVEISSKPGALGADEARITAFMQSYARRMAAHRALAAA